MRAVFLLTLLVLALASRALAGGAGGEYAVDVHDGEPFDDDATPNAPPVRARTETACSTVGFPEMIAWSASGTVVGWSALNAARIATRGRLLRPYARF